ncbi:MAG: SpoIID/LytB domain-containing protein [Calditrichia bacterium]
MMMKGNNRDIHLNNYKGEPVIRIGIIDNQDFMDFKVFGEFSIHNINNEEIISGIDTRLKWRVKIKESKPGQERFHLVLYESYHKEIVDERFKVALKFDEEAEIKEIGGNIFLNDKKINSNIKYLIVSGTYGSESEARKHFKKFRPEFNPTVIKETSRQPRGILEFFDAEYDYSGEEKNAFKVVPKNVNTKIRLFGLKRYDDLLQKEHFEDRVYNGSIEFRIDNNGKLMIISEIPLESYLKRVVYSEIGSDLPVEFSKSLAIVSRSEVMARIEHKHPGDPFDMCDWGHCLRYYGEDFHDENIETAVEDTRGQIIFSEHNICDAFFNLICGGHTEDAKGVWEIDESPQFHGKYDWKEVPPEFASLQDDEVVRKWILSRPEAWCNLRGRNVPASLEQYKKYFRWEVDYTRKELEKIIRRKTGEDIGIIFDIVPLKRGSSGRLKEIEIIGSLKNYRIRGELAIRESLAYEYLESSCFVIEKEMDEIGTPISFTLVGAGQGHGVGMCKTGAAVMAISGYNWQDILNHYFENCNIRNIYDLKLD